VKRAREAIVRRFLGKQNMMLTLSEIKELVDQLAERIGAPQNTLPIYGNSEQGDGVYVEVDSRGYHYVVAERGNEFKRHTTLDLDELLYDIFQSVTFGIACTYELNHRIYGRDSRRIYFERQEELLSLLNQSWGERRRFEHSQILKQHPFDDFSSIRATYSVELREQGHDSGVAWKMACEKYPLPKESED
jgi:hypothetical protein